MRFGKNRIIVVHFYINGICDHLILNCNFVRISNIADVAVVDTSVVTLQINGPKFVSLCISYLKPAAHQAVLCCAVSKITTRHNTTQHNTTQALVCALRTLIVCVDFAIG
jgi:hypothetical protein